MKVKKIYIKEFRQFKNLTLDLTYPKGHDKEGLPLEKICIIGQSGTGKTNLLKLLYLIRMPGEWNEKFNVSNRKLINNVAFNVVNSLKSEMVVAFKDSSVDSYALSENMMSAFYSKLNSYADILNDDNQISADLQEVVKFMSENSKENEKLIYFPAHLKYDPKESSYSKYNQNKKVFDFSKENIHDLWEMVIEEVTKYQEEELKFRQRISILAEQGNQEGTKKEVLNLKEWKENTVNPIKLIGENCINPLIKNFSLRVKEELSIEQKEDIGFIKLENFQKTEMSYSSWSTGTRQIVLSALPLYLIKPENSTILFDEPETSLYPDLQRIIVDYYQSLTKDSQFFYATHSPIVASCFEPWEIVELKFDDSGYVYREKYYEGDSNHIDNYYIDPRFLTFDLMLKEVFDMKYTNGDERYAALSEYGMLKNQLDTLKQTNQLQTETAKDIYKKFQTLARKLVLNPESNA